MTASARPLREIRLTNTLTGKKEVLRTRVPGRIGFYSCGPTVYGHIHIGNLRGGLVADLAYRVFRRAGYEVNYVRNYTDVDDKIIRKAPEEGITPEALARKYIGEVERDYAAAGMADPTHKPTVTSHMNEIVSLIGKIIERGHAYVAADGEVLFEIDSFPGYGKLSRKPLDELQAGARVEVSAKKKNPLDFALWKPAKPGEPSWESPWSAGRPGWHIECSAMAEKWLGEQIDVHHGGEDLIFPHHENEIAQSEAASGKEPFVTTWIHHAFVTMSQEKMSKSLGNIFTAREFLTRYGGEVARFLLLSAHYRSILDFDPTVIENAVIALQRLYEAKAKAEELVQQKKALGDMRAENAWGTFVAECEQASRELDENLFNDLNTPGAMAAVFTLIRAFNRTLAEPLAQATPSCVLGAQQLLKVIEQDLGSTIGIGRLPAKKALEDLERVRLELKGGAAAVAGRPQAAEIEAAIQARADARKAKDFAEADRIRKDLEARGVVLKDSPQGTSWSYS